MKNADFVVLKKYITNYKLFYERRKKIEERI